jgi:hypothetical protein
MPLLQRQLPGGATEGGQGVHVQSKQQPGVHTRAFGSTWTSETESTLSTTAAPAHISGSGTCLPAITLGACTALSAASAPTTAGCSDVLAASTTIKRESMLRLTVSGKQDKAGKLEA